jgi:hypothetical protein
VACSELDILICCRLSCLVCCTLYRWHHMMHVRMVAVPDAGVASGITVMSHMSHMQCIFVGTEHTNCSRLETLVGRRDVVFCCLPTVLTKFHQSIWLTDPTVAKELPA